MDNSAAMAASQRFEKQTLLQLHEKDAASCPHMKAEAETRAGTSNLSIFSLFTSNPPPISLQNLSPIALTELRAGHIHRGRVLHGTLCAEPFTISEIRRTMLEDENGRAVRVSVYNAPATRIFRKETKAAIKEPYFRVDEEGLLAICVYNPDNVEVSTESAAEEAERRRGDDCFTDSEWTAAVIHCVALATLTCESMAKNIMREREFILRGYCDIAEGRLQLGQLEQALEEFNKALQINGGDVTTLYGKGRALYGLSKFGEACEVFKKALHLNPGNEEILQALRQAKEKLEGDEPLVIF